MSTDPPSRLPIKCFQKRKRVRVSAAKVTWGQCALCTITAGTLLCSREFKSVPAIKLEQQGIFTKPEGTQLNYVGYSSQSGSLKRLQPIAQGRSTGSASRGNVQRRQIPLQQQRGQKACTGTPALSAGVLQAPDLQQGFLPVPLC